MTYTYNLLGIKMSFKNPQGPAWLYAGLAALVLIANILLTAAIAFECIDILFNYKIEFTFSHVLAIFALKLVMFNNGND